MIAILSIIISALVSHNVVFFGGIGTFAADNRNSADCLENRQTEDNGADSLLKKPVDDSVGSSGRKSCTKRAVMLGVFVAAVVFLSGIICWLANLLLVEINAEFLAAFVCVVVSALLAVGLDLMLKKFKPEWRVGGTRLVLAAAVSAALVTATGIMSLSAVKMLFAAVFSGLGYLLALLLIDGIVERMETANVPRFFRGVPILVLAAAIIAFAFMGFGSFSFTIS